MIGNKADLSYKITVSRDEAQIFAEKYGIKYLERSAMNGSELGDPFGILSCLMIGIPIPVKFLKDTFILEPKSKIELTIEEVQKNSWYGSHSI